jgi:hypothetical protein
MKTPLAAVQQLKGLFRNASSALVEALRIEIDGDRVGFCVPQIAIAATKDQWSGNESARSLAETMTMKQSNTTLAMTTVPNRKRGSPADAKNVAS